MKETERISRLIRMRYGCNDEKRNKSESEIKYIKLRRGIRI